MFLTLVMIAVVLDVAVIGPSLSALEDLQTQTWRNTIDEEVGNRVAYFCLFLCTLDSPFFGIAIMGDISEVKPELHKRN